MMDPKQYDRLISCRVPSQVLRDVTALAKRSGVPRSEIVREALTVRLKAEKELRK